MSDSNPNIKGTILVTGANGSLGSALVSRIVSQADLAAYRGVYTVRNAGAAPNLKSALQKGKFIDFHSYDILSLELTNLANVRAVAAAINDRVASGQIPPIQALVLNAGYLEFSTQTWTDDGFDSTFASNYLGHWLLTLLLLQSMDRETGRIVVIGSESHDPHNSKNKSSFNNEKWMTFIRDEGCDAIAEGTWSSTKEDPSFHGGFRRYGASKFCLATMIPELQRRLDIDSNLGHISVLGIDPGSISTGITRRGPWVIRVLIFKLILPWLARIAVWLQPNGPIRTIELGTKDIIAVAVETVKPVGKSPKAMYFYGSRVEEMTAEAKDEEKQKRLWIDSLRYTRLKEGETVLTKWK